MDKEVDVVAESDAKTKGGVTVSPITIVPIKIEYGARISDEFMYAAQDAQIDYLTVIAGKEIRGRICIGINEYGDGNRHGRQLHLSDCTPDAGRELFGDRMIRKSLARG